MIKWLKEIINSYKKAQKHDVDLQWILALLFVLWDTELLRELEPKHFQGLFKELCAIPQSTSKYSYFTAAQEKILKNDSSRAKVVKILKWMQVKTISFKQSIPEILFTFPMCHFAQGLCVPFADASILPIVNHNTKSALQDFKNATINWYVYTYQCGFLASYTLLLCLCYLIVLYPCSIHTQLV